MILYQTLRDRENPDYIEKNAPFHCNRKNAWLGPGYYFWDTLINNAHWWGAKSYSDEYIIVKFTCDDNHERCFDIHGNMEHVQFLKECFECLVNDRLADNYTTVPWLIEYIKKTTDFKVRFDGIRACGQRSKNYENTVTMYFNNRLKAFLDLEPAVQLCFFKKNTFNITKGEIVFPSHYVKGYVV
jgi:hypothetical protein